MRSKFLLVSLLLVVCAVVAQQTNKYAGSRIMLREVMESGAGLVDYFEKQDLEIVKIDIDLVGIDNSKTVVKSMSADYAYIIGAKGQPSRIEDLDIEVYHVGTGGTTTLIDKDELEDNSPAVTFTPPVSGNYLIVVKVAKMRKAFIGSMGFYFLTVAHN